MNTQDKFSKYSTEQLTTLLKTIRSQNIGGYTQQIGDEVEHSLSLR